MSYDEVRSNLNCTGVAVTHSAQSSVRHMMTRIEIFARVNCQALFEANS